EELNRVLTDHLSDLLLCPSETAVENLEREHAAGRIELVGDGVVHVALLFQPRALADTAPLERAGVEPGGYVLVTAHRAGNVDDPARLRLLVDLLLALPVPAVLPLHPRTPARLQAAGWLPPPARACVLPAVWPSWSPRRACGSSRRWATSSSPRCSATRERSSPTRAGC